MHKDWKQQSWLCASIINTHAVSCLFNLHRNEKGKKAKKWSGAIYHNHDLPFLSLYKIKSCWQVDFESNPHKDTNITPTDLEFTRQGV